MAKYCSRLNSLHTENSECATSASPWLRPFTVDEETIHQVKISSNQRRPSAHRKSYDVDLRNLLEPLFERRWRYLSLAVVAFAAFTFNLSLSATSFGLESYLSKLDSQTSPPFITAASSAIPIAQLLLSPLVGFLSNKIGSIRVLSIISLLMLTSSCVLYATVRALSEPRRWFVLVAHFIIGAASGSVALFTSYTASATTLRERTTAFSCFNFAASTALFLGPASQLAFTPLERGIPMGSDLFLDLYTGPPWLSAAAALVSIIAFLPFSFLEYHIAKREGDLLAQRAQTRKCKTCLSLCTSPNRRLSEPDRRALIVCIFIFSSSYFCFCLFERLATKLTIENLGLGESFASITTVIAFACAAIISALVFLILGPLARRFRERSILAVGIISLVIGPLCLIPLPGPLPPVKTINDSNYTLGGNATQVLKLFEMEFNLTERLHGGCPMDRQPWCGTIPAIRQEQLAVGFLFIVIGFALSTTTSSSVFSKIIGPHSQGTWMGFLLSGACLARALCPVTVETVYPVYGPWATFGFVCVLMTVVLFVLIVNYKRLVPFSYEEKVGLHEDESHLVPYVIRPPKL